MFTYAHDLAINELGMSNDRISIFFYQTMYICNTPHAISSLLYIYLLGTYMGLMTFNVRAFTGMLNHLSYIELS